MERLRWLALVLACLCLWGCARQETAVPVAYTVTVRTAGGMAMDGITVELRKDGEVVCSAVTDRDGKISAQLPPDSYRLALRDVDVGYAVEESYPLTEQDTVLTLRSAPIPPEQGSPLSLGLGDVMYDLTLTTADGGSVTLSKVLEEKDVVLLDFWYSGCPNCSRSFGAMEVAYSSYRKDAQILAVDPLEDMDTVAAYQKKHSLSFPMASCPSSWVEIFGVTRYPAIFVIDRYGVICAVQWGAPAGSDWYQRVFETFTGEDYVQRIYPNGFDR